MAVEFRKRPKIRLLPTKQSQLLFIAPLPKVEGHGDPFGLLVNAQALTDNLPVLTSAGKFPLYGINVVR